MNLSPDPLVRIMELFSDPTFLMGYFIIASMTLAMCCFACAIFWMGKFYEAYKERSRRLEAVTMALGELLATKNTDTDIARSTLQLASTLLSQAQAQHSASILTYKVDTEVKKEPNSRRPQA